jgi:hypothetical protein
MDFGFWWPSYANAIPLFSDGNDSFRCIAAGEHKNPNGSCGPNPAQRL